MATKILTNYNLASGDTLTNAIADVGSIVIAATVAGGNSKEIKFTLMAQEGDSGYSPVLCGEEKTQATFFMKGSDADCRIKFEGVDATNVKVQVLTRGAVGTLTIQYTKTANTLS